MANFHVELDGICRAIYFPGEASIPPPYTTVCIDPSFLFEGSRQRHTLFKYESKVRSSCCAPCTADESDSEPKFYQ